MKNQTAIALLIILVFCTPIYAEFPITASQLGENGGTGFAGSAGCLGVGGLPGVPSGTLSIRTGGLGGRGGRGGRGGDGGQGGNAQWVVNAHVILASGFTIQNAPYRGHNGGWGDEGEPGFFGGDGGYANYPFFAFGEYGYGVGGGIGSYIIGAPGGDGTEQGGGGGGGSSGPSGFQQLMTQGGTGHGGIYSPADDGDCGSSGAFLQQITNTEIEVYQNLQLGGNGGQGGRGGAGGHGGGGGGGAGGGGEWPAGHGRSGGYAGYLGAGGDGGYGGTGWLTIEVDGHFENHGTIAVNVISNGLFVGSGLCTGSLDNTGIVSPGRAGFPGNMTVQDLITTDGTVLIQLGGTSHDPLAYDRLTITETFNIEGGNLSLEFLDGFDEGDLVYGDYFDIVFYQENLSQQFAPLDDSLAPLANGFWELNYQQYQGEGIYSIRLYYRGDMTPVFDQNLNPDVPATYALESLHPNPFNPMTTISYALPEAGVVNFGIYDLSGRLVWSSGSSVTMAAGRHEFRWNGTDSKGLALASGTYLLQMKAGGCQDIRKLMLVR